MKLFGDARRGVNATVDRMAATGTHRRSGADGSMHTWLFPYYVCVVATMPIVGAFQGYWQWPLALLAFAGFGLVALLLLGRLGRRTPPKV